MGLPKSTPRKAGVPALADVGTKNLPRLWAPLKYSMLVAFAICGFRKIAPKPRVAAGFGAAGGFAGMVKSSSIVLSLNIANVFDGLNAGNKPLAPGLTATNPSPATAYTSRGSGSGS